MKVFLNFLISMLIFFSVNNYALSQTFVNDSGTKNQDARKTIVTITYADGSIVRYQGEQVKVITDELNFAPDICEGNWTGSNEIEFTVVSQTKIDPFKITFRNLGNCTIVEVETSPVTISGNSFTVSYEIPTISSGSLSGTFSDDGNSVSGSFSYTNISCNGSTSGSWSGEPVEPCAQPPDADFTGSPISGTAPLTVNFTDKSTSEIDSWSWDFGDGGSSTQQNPSHTYNNAGNYTISLTVTGPGGSDTRTRTNYITVTELGPVADFTGSPTSGANPLTVQFSDQSTGNITSWSWDFGDGSTSTQQNPSHTYTNSGTYTVELTVTGPGGSDSKTRTNYITVTESGPVADFTGSPTSGVKPLTVQFTDQSTGNITSWSWDFGDGGTSTEQNPSYTYTEAGTYTVSLTVTGPDGSDARTRTDYITVIEPGPAPLPGEYPTDANTVLLLHMNETSGSFVADSSGRGNHGMAEGTTIVDGRFGKARRFDSDESGEWVTVTDHPSLNFGAGDFTVEAWVNTNYVGGSHGIVVKGVTGTHYEIGIGNESGIIGAPYLVFSDQSDNDFIVIAVSSINDGNWHHIAGVRRGATAELYVDGILEGTEDQSQVGSTDNASALIIDGLPGSVFVDEVRISNKARRQDEFNIAPPASDLKAFATLSNIQLTWTASPVSNIQEYRVYRSTSIPATNQIGTVAPNQTAFTDNDVVNGTKYFYRMTAVSAFGVESIPTAHASAIAGDPPPAAPQNLRATAGDESVTLNWDANSEPDFLRYNVYGATSPNPNSLVLWITGVNNTSTTVTGLTNGVPHYFRIAALDNNQNESGISNEVMVTPRPTFTPVATGEIISAASISSGASWGDYDNDGDQDVFLANLTGNNALFANNGDGTFAKIGLGSIVNDGGGSLSGIWGDYDNDGDLDLFVTDHDVNNFLYANNGNGTFTKITSGPVVDEGGSQGGSWGDYNNDGFLDLFVANQGDNNYLYANNGSGTFTKITEGPVVNDGGKSNGCSWADIDNDGDLDLFVANEFENNFLYRNNSDGTFTKITNDVVVNDGHVSTGGAWGDIDNDGDLDLFVAGTGGNDNNLLYSNNGDGTFTQITNDIVANDGGFSQAANWVDFDNDGDLDLYVANGIGQNNFLYSNNGDGSFTKVIAGDIVSDGSQSIGSSWADMDNDGDLDLIVPGNTLYRNNGNDNHWINIKCVGRASNTAAIGAKVKAKAQINGEPVWQMTQISGSTGFFGQNSLNAEFGLGDATVIDSLKIEWPSGIVQVLEQVSTDQFLVVEEDSTLTSVGDHLSQIPKQFALSQNYPNPFNPKTTIQYELSKTSQVKLDIFNLLGQRIATLVDAVQPAGIYSIQWDAEDDTGREVASGIYLYRLETEKFIRVKKLALIR